MEEPAHPLPISYEDVIAGRATMPAYEGYLDILLQRMISSGVPANEAAEYVFMKQSGEIVGQLDKLYPDPKQVENRKLNILKRIEYWLANKSYGLAGKPVKLARWRLRHDVDVNSPIWYGYYPPLLSAARYNDLQLFKACLANPRINLNVAFEHDDVMKVILRFNSSPEMARLLLRHPDFKISNFYEDHLCLAINNGRVEIAEMLARNPNVKITGEELNHAVYHEYQFMHVISYLLQRPDIKPFLGQMLTAAIIDSKSWTMDRILELPSVKTIHESFLFKAIEYTHPAALQTLLSHKKLELNEEIALDLLDAIMNNKNYQDHFQVDRLKMLSILMSNDVVLLAASKEGVLERLASRASAEDKKYLASALQGYIDWRGLPAGQEKLSILKARAKQQVHAPARLPVKLLPC
jgi:hypothetical protein